MKNLVFIFLLAISANLFASDYKEAMVKNIEKLNSSQNPTELVDLANAFDRIAQKETSEWLPVYYASYANLSVLFFDKSLNSEGKNAVLDKAQLKLDAAKKITETESEIFVLQALIYQMRITDPSLGQKYFMLVNEALGRADALNPNNPRVSYMKGTMAFYTPAEYGGGKAVAKLLFEKAAKLFADADKSNPLLPTWGVQHNGMMLEQCK